MKVTIQVVVEEKERKELKALAKAERRTLSNLLTILIDLGKEKHFEQSKGQVA